ncbi:unnamed protein product [Fraxinus pennsylvanica]|uniref:Uncharacterized protein n=1 Tax=Fraxinus pennsylvanica TaxID=56036 RepID=A0AAD2DQR1_9LAMI|nr:unnamed protein product [Fraxinus pennsylvanica]
MAEKVTVMVLKVDLQCASCYEKIKTIVCKIPQIRGQIYDVKQNTVTINVVCCSPKKIRDELCCKGGKVIKNIEIQEPESPKTPDMEPGRPRVCVRPPPPPPPPPPSSPPPPPPSSPPPSLLPPPAPVNGPEIRITLDQPARTCCEPCSQGYGGGPCYHGYPAPPLCSNSYYGYGYGRECKCGCGCGCGCGRGCHLRKCVCYIEENPRTECKIM